MYWGGSVFDFDITTPDRRQSKMLILSTEVDKKSLETELSIAICHPTGHMAIKNTISSDFSSTFVDC